MKSTNQNPDNPVSSICSFSNNPFR